MSLAATIHSCYPWRVEPAFHGGWIVLDGLGRTVARTPHEAIANEIANTSSLEDRVAELEQRDAEHSTDLAVLHGELDDSEEEISKLRAVIRRLLLEPSSAEAEAAELVKGWSS